MANIDLYIDSLDLEPGERKRTHCPMCNGYNTFSVSNDMGDIMWNCFKAGCGTRGAKSVNLTGAQILDRMRMGDGPSNMLDTSFELPEHVTYDMGRELVFKGKHELDKDVEILWDVKDGRYVFPIYNGGELVDAVGRNDYKIPKWLRYGKSGYPYVHGIEGNDTAVVVEDCISAAVVGSCFMNLTGVALLGTSLGDIHKKVLSGYSTVIIALDYDAKTKQAAMVKELRSHCSIVYSIGLVDDIKYRNETDMELLTEWNLR